MTRRALVLVAAVSFVPSQARAANALVVSDPALDLPTLVSLGCLCRSAATTISTPR